MVGLGIVWEWVHLPYTLEMAVQSLMGGNRHPFTKTSINHVLQLV